MELFLLALLAGSVSMAILGVLILALSWYDGLIQAKVLKERRRATPWNS